MPPEERGSDQDSSGDLTCDARLPERRGRPAQHPRRDEDEHEVGENVGDDVRLADQARERLQTGLSLCGLRSERAHELTLGSTPTSLAYAM